MLFMRSGEGERDANEREDGPSRVQCYFKDSTGHVSFGTRMANSKITILGTPILSWAPSAQWSMLKYNVRRTGELYGVRIETKEGEGMNNRRGSCRQWARRSFWTASEIHSWVNSSITWRNREFIYIQWRYNTQVRKRGKGVVTAWAKT